MGDRAVPETVARFARACRHCDEHVVYAVDRLGVELALTAEADAAGNYAVTPTSAGVLFAAHVTRGVALGMTRSSVPLHLPHVHTCRRPEEWHKGPKPSRTYARQTRRR